MFITRKRFKEELENARQEGWAKAMERQNTDDKFRSVHDRINRLADKINQPNRVGFETGERKC